MTFTEFVLAPEMLQKTNLPGYFKDSNTNIVVNRSPSEYAIFQAEKSRLIELNKIKEEIRDLKIEISKIKEILLSNGS